MSENEKCTHELFRVRTEVDHEGMDLTWLECLVCGVRLYAVPETPEQIATLTRELAEAREWIDGYTHERESTIAVGEELARQLENAEDEREHLREKLENAIEDSARAENAQRDAERVSRQLRASAQHFEALWRAAESDRRKTDIALTAATERAEKAEALNEYQKVVIRDCAKAITRLTAEVEEWKKKAEMLVEWYDKFKPYLSGGGLGLLAHIVGKFRRSTPNRKGELM